MGGRDDDVFDKMQYPPGSFEAHHSAWYPNKQVRSARQRTHIVNPSISFKTDIPEDIAFLKMLKVLNQADFKWLARYRGPRIGVRVPRGQTVDADKLITALETVEISSLPLTGIKAVLVHDRDQGHRQGERHRQDQGQAQGDHQVLGVEEAAHQGGQAPRRRRVTGLSPALGAEAGGG